MKRMLLQSLGVTMFVVGLSGWTLADGGPPSAPEIDAGMVTSGLALLSGGLMVLTGRKRPRS